jgi:chromate transporter
VNFAQLFELFGHCFTLSLLAIGGVLGTAPDLQRFVVVERGWLTAADFTASVALAQSAPGPNLLFIAVVGYQVAGLAGAAAAMAGILLPSTVLTLAVFRFGSRRRDSRAVRAFMAGMAPISLGLVWTTGGVLAAPVIQRPAALLLLIAAIGMTWRTKAHPLWLIGLGAVAGASGWI